MNAEIVKIGNRTHIKLSQGKSFSETRRIWGENRSIVVYRMDFTVDFPMVKIKNLNEYRIDDGDAKIFLNYTKASFVKLQLTLYYLEYDYVDIFGKRIYTNFGHYNRLRCETIPVNITENNKGEWVKVPVFCAGG